MQWIFTRFKIYCIVVDCEHSMLELFLCVLCLPDGRLPRSKFKYHFDVVDRAKQKKKCKIKTNTNTTIQMKWWNVIFFSPSGRFVEILWAQANIDCVSCGRNAFGRLKHQRSTVDIVVFSPSHDRAIVHVHMLTMSVRTLSIEPNVIFTLQLNTSNISLATWSTLPAKWLVVFVVDVSVHLRCKIYI